MNDKRHGKGRCVYANGDVYEGDFVNDKRHGKGKYIYADGRVEDGWSENGYFKDGVTYNIEVNDRWFKEDWFKDGWLKDVKTNNGNVYDEIDRPNYKAKEDNPWENWLFDF